MSFDDDALLLNVGKTSSKPDPPSATIVADQTPKIEMTEVPLGECDNADSACDDDAATGGGGYDEDADPYGKAAAFDEDVRGMFDTFMRGQADPGSFPGGSPMSSRPLSPSASYHRHHHQSRRKNSAADQAAKREILYRIQRLQRKGVAIPRDFTMEDDLEDMREMLERVERDISVDRSINFQRQALMTFAAGVEFLNMRFDPVGLKLDGWSNSISESIEDYDEVFEELHLKYSGKMKMPPEVQLLFMLGCSGTMFHLSNTMFKDFPEMSHVFKTNPDLMSHFMSAAANTMGPSAPEAAGAAQAFASMFAATAPPPQAAHAARSPPPTAHQHHRPPPPPPASYAAADLRGPSISVEDMLNSRARQEELAGAGVERDADAVSVVTTGTNEAAEQLLLNSKARKPRASKPRVKRSAAATSSAAGAVDKQKIDIDI